MDEKVYSLNEKAPQMVQPEAPVVEPADTNAEEDLGNVSISFIKERRDQVLLDFKKLVDQRNQMAQQIRQMDERISSFRSYILAMNDLLPEDVRKDVPAELSAQEE